MQIRSWPATILPVIAIISAVYFVVSWVAKPVVDDPLVRMPGTQPAQGVNLEAPNRCLNCHGGFNPAVEPGFNWQGSMMAQAARDFLFWSCLTVAAQDSVWALGNPNAVDICERCHFPEGWLGGRSDPPNASAMAGSDFDGVHCDFCHTMYDPFFKTTYLGTREGSDWSGYWDEHLNSGPGSGTLSQLEADATYAEDGTLAAGIRMFSGGPFYIGNLPKYPTYMESGSGQYFVSTSSQKRASFADAAARHQMLYSRYHKSKYFCSTCHDVSNPALANLGKSGLPDQSGGVDLITEQYSAASYFHVERTFSEFRLSDYGQAGGAPGIGPFSPATFETSYATNNIAKCQDCHMRDVVGKACNKQGVPIRPNDSAEHPMSGQPLHDLTGGNAWVSFVLASAVPGSPNHDPVNDQLLNQGPALLTLDMTQGLGIDPVSLLAGVDRSKQQLLLAAAINNVSYDSASGALSFRVQNQTGHKLISGFPEGRRMFVNIRAYSGGSVIYEVNPYDAAAGTLKGLSYSYQPDPSVPMPEPIAVAEAYVDELVYEMHPTSTLTGEQETFHFALADGRYKDNRIPPKGFRIADADTRLCVPMWHGAPAPGYFTAAEYDGGYDDVALTIPAGADGVEVNLYYQTTSREYIEFLRDEINGAGNITLPTTPFIPGPPDPANYIIQSDPFFTGLKAWGDTIWQLWTHTMSVPGAAPFLMAQAIVGAGGGPCNAPVPALLTATPGHTQVVLTWSDEHTADPGVVGYNLYYDQLGKAQLIAQLGLVTSYTDAGLTNGQQYSYKVTSRYAACESGYSNVLSAIPNNQGQAVVGVNPLEVGRYQTIGKGRQKTTAFVLADLFTAGELVVIRAHVADTSTGLPVASATVELVVAGLETPVFAPGASDVNGIAEFAWQTTAPNKRGQGGTALGAYTATVTKVAAAGYAWDGVMTAATFTLQ
ncbi:MAG: fibronectin type III domain-containing protein [Armatimonadota bacterium]|nr:MAG: fibronectin type III domain-containing protein [Armatimonadota bacterium]